MASSLSRGKTTMNIIKANPALVSLIFGYLSFRAQPAGGMLEKKISLYPLLKNDSLSPAVWELSCGYCMPTYATATFAPQYFIKLSLYKLSGHPA